MLRLDDLQILVRTAELGSLSAVARELNFSPAVASAAIKRLERELGVRLLSRSTRSLKLTREGECYLAYARSALNSLEQGRHELASMQGAISGHLSLAAPSDIGRNRLVAWLDTFQREHPGLNFRLALSDRLSDLYRHPVDLAIRYGLPEDSNLVALALAPDNRRVLCAAPDYLARAGRPVSLEAIAGHEGLLFMLNDQVYDRWRFGDGKSARTVTMRAAWICDDGDAVRRFALAGRGLAYKSWLDIADDVAAGELELVLPELASEPAPLYLLCPHRQQLSPAVNRLRDFLAERCRRLTLAMPESLRR